MRSRSSISSWPRARTVIPWIEARRPVPGWIIRDGEDAGAFGVGYRKGQLETRTYTISTACAGAQACAALYRLTGDEVLPEDGPGCGLLVAGAIR